MRSVELHGSPGNSNAASTHQNKQKKSFLTPELIGVGVLVIAAAIGFGAYEYFKDRPQTTIAEIKALQAPGSMVSETDSGTTMDKGRTATPDAAAPATTAAPDAVVGNDAPQASDQAQIDAANDAAQNDLAAAQAAREEAEQARAEAVNTLAQAQTAKQQSDEAQTVANARAQVMAQPADDAGQTGNSQATVQDQIPQPENAAQTAPTPDEEYSHRAHSECAGGFLGKACRHKIRVAVCAGKSANDPGATVCK